MKNKNVYLSIGIIIILIVSIAAYVQYSSQTSLTTSPSPTLSSSPSSSPSVSSSPTPFASSSPSESATPNPTTSNPSASPSSYPSPSTTPSSQTVSVTVTSNTAGSGSLNIDGSVFALPAQFNWVIGSTHSLQAISPVAGSAGSQYVWASWSDGGAQTHDYVVSSSSVTIAANYKTQYQLTFAQSGLDSSANGTVVSTSGGVTSTRTYANMSSISWIDAGAQISYSYQANVSTTVPSALFILNSTPSSSSLTVNAPITVNASYGRAVFDYTGKLIHLPPASQINRIADSWPAHNTIIVLVGARDKIVATSPTDTTIVMFQRIHPPIKTMLAPWDSSGNPNIEQLLVANPDIVFVSSTSETPAAAVENAGMLVVRLNFFDFTEMTKCVQLTGWILGEDALAKANAYVSYFNGVIANVTAQVSQVPASQKQSILHMVGNRASPISVDAGGGLVNTWINLCGGINAAASVSGNTATVSIEQVLSWNPDIVLIGSASANSVKDTIMNDAAWSQVNAVTSGKVIANPMGVFDWSRYSIEEALNIQWVAKLLYPDKFANIDMRVETKTFYQTFYGYTLSDAEIDAILNNTPLT